MTYACAVPFFEFEITGTEGSVVLQRQNLDSGSPGYQISDMIPSQQTMQSQFECGCLDREFIAFAKSFQQLRDPNFKLNDIVDINTPQEALEDLVFVESCLESGRRPKKN